MKSYAFWNNKGGTGKTSLCYQTVLAYAKAKDHKDERILVIDACPQANLSELFLGGMEGNGSDRLIQMKKSQPHRSIGGHFDNWLKMKPVSRKPEDLVVNPRRNFNEYAPENVDILLGDPLLERQTHRLAYEANRPTTSEENPWMIVMQILREFIDSFENGYDAVFIDCNPSFSVYTQIALLATDRLIVPVMADDSSRRALETAISLVYGLEIPSDLYKPFEFSKKLDDARGTPPKIHLIIENNTNQYAQEQASAYAKVLENTRGAIDNLLQKHPEIFNFEDREEGTVEAKSFQTPGVLAFAHGMGFDDLKTSHRIGSNDRRGTGVKPKDKQKLVEISTRSSTNCSLYSVTCTLTRLMITCCRIERRLLTSQ